MAIPSKNKLPSGQLDKIFSSGRTYAGQSFTFKIIANGLNQSRFAFLVPVKIASKATKRNSIRRKLSEALRDELPNLIKGYDVVVLARTKDMPLNEVLKQELITLLEKSGMLNK